MAVLVLKKRSGLIPIPMGEGRTLHITPIGGADVELAGKVARANLRQVVDGKASAARYGLTLDAENPAAGIEKDGQVDVGVVILAIELANRHVKQWEGLEIETGETDAEGKPVTAPAPIEPATIELFLNDWNPELYLGLIRESNAQRFYRQVLALSTLEPAAKNVSTASPTSSTAAAVDGAGIAGRSGDPA